MNARRSFWFPSLSAFIWLAFFLALCLSNWRHVLVSADGDPSLHWRIGNWMIEHREILRTDNFSHTKPDAPVITKEWLSEIVFAAVSNALGWNGAVFLAAAMIATTLWGLHRLLLYEKRDLLLATLLVLLTSLAMSNHWLARPHLVTHLMTLGFIWQLRRLERGDQSPARFVVWMTALMCLWANLHGAFFTGFVLLGLYAAGNLKRPHIAVPVAIGAAGAAIGSLLNPNGWRLHAHILEFIREPLLAGYVSEFRSPNFHSGAMQGFLLLLLVMVLLLVVARPVFRLSDALLLGVWSYFALHSVRNIPILALVAAPILAEHWTAWLRRRRDEEGRTTWHRTSERLAERHQHAGGVGLVIVTAAVMLFAMARGSLKTELLPQRFPVRAVAALQQNSELASGNMFNAYGWGGYLMLEMPERKVFVDSRNDFYGAEFMREFDQPDEVQGGWEQILDTYAVAWTILPLEHPLNRVLELDDRWKETYRDDVTMCFQRSLVGPDSP